MGGNLSADQWMEQNSRNVTSEGNNCPNQHRDLAATNQVDFKEQSIRQNERSVNSERSGSRTKTQEKCYDPEDATLTFVDGPDDLDFLCEDFKSLRAKMSCGHAVTPMSLTKWCRRLLDKGNFRFECGCCDKSWPFEEVCKMALLTPKEKYYFEQKMLNNASNSYLDIKKCPGCESRVKRTDLNDLSVECTVCTAVKGRIYRFCCRCLKEWKGSDLCENDGCRSSLELLRNCPEITFKDVRGVTGCPCIRACPTCGLLIEHNKTQCKTMVCRRCKVKFCFACLRITDECLKRTPYDPCRIGVAPRQTSIPVWKRK